MIDLIDGLKKCGILEEVAPELAQKMEAYIKEIILFNSAYNLTNTSDRDELVVRHIFDSLAAWPKIKAGFLVFLLRRLFLCSLILLIYILSLLSAWKSVVPFLKTAQQFLDSKT